MHSVREVVRPSKEEWASLPRRRSGVRTTLMAWLLGLGTVGGAFVADTGWDDAPPSWDESLHPMSILIGTSAVIVTIFAAGGWNLGRRAVYFLPLILAPISILAVGCAAPSAFVWALGLVLSCVLAANEFGPALRQLRMVRQLAFRLKDGTQVQLGDYALASERRVFRAARWVVAGFAAVSAVGWVWFAIGMDGCTRDGSTR